MLTRYAGAGLLRKTGRKKSDRGFTLVEMIVTMVVLSIVLSLSVAGLLSWQDWANFNKQNEYAQVLFVAAQNQLAEYCADGRLAQMQESLSGGGLPDEIDSGEKQYEAVGLNLTDSIALLKNPEGQVYALDTLFPESKNKTNKGFYQDEIISLRAESGEYAKYLADPDGLKNSNPEAYWVFELLGSYVYDTSILNGSRQSDGSGDGAAICVEITPEDGQVFSVLYSDKNDKFIYMGVPNDKKGTAEQKGVADISDRTETYRKERMVGYYGVDTLYVSTKNEVVQPSIASVRLYNKDTFYMTCRLSAKYRQKLTSQLTYVMDLDASKNVNDKKLTLKLDGTKLKNKQNAEVIDCPVSRYDADGNEIALGDFPVLAWVEKDYTVHVVLDAADIQATTELYESELDDIRSADKAASTKFAKTCSFFRFGVEADNVYASVTATGSGFTTSKTVSNFGNLNILKNQGEKHTTFAGEQKSENGGKTDFTYSVINARHLYNIRYIEDLSYEKEAGSSELADKTGSVTFILKSDIDWSKFEQDGQLYDSYQTARHIKLSSLDQMLVDADGNTIDKVTTYNCDFPSISQVRQRDCIDGNQKKITGIAVSEIANALYGIYLSEEGGTLVMDDNRPAGLVNINYGEIKDLKLDDITVSGCNFVGGFCGINAGKIEGLETLSTDEKSLIAGRKHVGGIVGFQIPSAKDQVVEKLVNRAAVEGVMAVGGIIGMVRNDFVFQDFDLTKLAGLPSQVKQLLNQPAELEITVRSCENYGAVSGVNFSQLREIYSSGSDGGTKAAADPASEDATEPRYIGGIVGYCYNKNQDPAKLTIETCTSAPQYKGEELLSILSDETVLMQHLKGVYVGGIVGYNYFGQINNSSTRPEKDKYGCLFGYRYVGGIVGFNIGPASGIVGSDTVKQGENDNHVIAYEYAGGITGCNANVRDVDSLNQDISGEGAKDPETLKGLLLADSDRNLKVKIDNWINKGIVIAVNEYAGGITGYNAGYIYRCNSDVESSVADTYFAALTSGDYAGGIAGYNNGVIGNTRRKISEDGSSSTVIETGTKFSTICYVKGHNYVGGIVGYNDVDSVVEDYEIASGYVLGDEGSCFVGGYAGINASVDLLMNMSSDEREARLIYSNPNHVQGSYFVGGNIGGNIINMADNQSVEQINGVFKTDNFLGILEGKAFVGGFVGYNLLFHNAAEDAWIANDPDRYRGAVYIVQRELVDAFEKSDASVSDVQRALTEKKEILDDLSEKLNLAIKESDKPVCISGRGAESTKVSFGTISGQIFVGGVLGYNDEKTNLTIQNVENATPIEATESISCPKEQVIAVDEETGKETYRTTDYNGETKEYTYSYAGGMLGKVSKKTVLYNCWNASSGTVTTKGTYTGGLCEINEGLIDDCTVSNFGSSVQDYVGGLCGLNKKQIENCAIVKKTVSGRNVVGGITAENFGTISDIKLEGAKLLAEGKIITGKQKHGVCGMYTGFNGTGGTIILKDDIEKITITSGGRYVGGVAGINEGTVKNQKTVQNKKGASGTEDNLVISGTIRGYQTVGSLFGLNNCQDETKVIANYTNEAAVTATNGYAGGIIGENASDNTIRYCVNQAVVTASDAGDAGGITSSNNGKILNCYDYKTVTAPEGMCGGITVVNEADGVIKNCYVGPDEDASSLKFRSTKVVGGIAAQNAGEIAQNTLKNVTITNETTVTGTCMGIVVGENLAGGKIDLSGSSQGSDMIDACSTIIQSNYCKAGGIAGTNAGSIAGAQGESGMATSVVNCQMSMKNATIANMGGVAGVNTGVITDVAVDAYIQGDLGSTAAGYGGIAGYSGYTSQKEEYPALIRNCSFDGVINANGSSGTSARIGGIAGINGYGSKVEDCFIGAREADAAGQNTVESGKTYVTAGDYLHKTADSVNSTDTKSYSNLGGIAGDNYGWISACDNAEKSVDEVHIIGFAGETGGIVGFNYEGGIVSGYLDEDGVTKHYLSTGKNWEVEQRCCGNDRGPGGIIGKTVSAEDLRYVINYAPVTCAYQSNTYVGGLIGIVELKNAVQLNFVECENYGKVSSSRSSGGMIGFLLSCGASFERCTNWGDVTATTLRSGGFVSLQYTSPQGCEFKHCANHGNISVTKTSGERYLGGFVANQKGAYKVDGKDGITYFYDCVNTGVIRDEKNKAVNSNFGVFGGLMQTVAYLELCRNYNTEPSCTNGFIGGGGKSTYIKNCLDNSNGKTLNTEKTPYAGTLTGATNACYLDETSETTFSHDSYGVYFSMHEGSNQDAKMDYNAMGYSDLRNPSVYFSEPDRSNEIKLYNTNPRLWISLSYDEDSQGLNSFVVYFWNGSKKVDSAAGNTYGCQATFYYQDGTSAETDNQTAAGYFAVCDESKVVLTNPRPDKKPVSIQLAFSGGSPVYLRGFSFIPEQESASGREAVCTYSGEKYDTTFSIDKVQKTTTAGVSSSVTPKTKTPLNNRYCYINDVLDIDWKEYTTYYYTIGRNETLDITFQVENGDQAPGMDSFVFYLANDNMNVNTADDRINTHYYDYSVTFTDVLGNTADSEVVKDAVGYDSGVPGYMEKSRQEVKIPDGLDARISSITLHIVATKYSYVRNGVTKEEKNNIGYIYLRGFTWVPKGRTEQKMAAGIHVDATKSATDRQVTNQNNNIILTRLKVDKSSGTPYVYAPQNYNTGFSMTHQENDPIATTYYEDRTSVYQESLTEDGKSGRRIDTYLDLDPKFLSLTEDMSIVYRKLQDPANLQKNETNSFMRFSWNRVRDAYAYEVYYQILDSENQVVYGSDPEMIGSMQQMYDVKISNDWPNDSRIVFYVRAVNAYHPAHDDENEDDYDAEYTKYDSDWVCSDGGTVKKAPPRPVLHLEIVAGDKTVAVLDNYEEYVAQGCTDCTIYVSYKGADLSWNLAETGKYSKPRYVEVPGGTSQATIIYYAKPNESLAATYANSAAVTYLGEGLGNNTLPGRDMYCTTYYQGFYGTDPDSMEYRIQFQLSDQDSYLLTDISAYDEEVGATVAYDHEITHTANSFSGGGNLKLTSTLKNLPEEWFGEDYVSKVTVRAYPYRSQFEMFHYGHEVADGICLDGTAEENRAVLAGIFDEYYFAADAEAPTQNCIWSAEKGDLKDGYVLQRQGDGSYAVYYSAVIESSLQAAAVRRAENDEPYREYYNYAVGYAIYSDMNTETGGTIRVNSKDYQESYWVRRMEAGNGDHKNYSNTKTDTADRLPIQERQSVPMVEENVTSGTDETGHTQYTFKWDVYYQDTKCSYKHTNNKSILTNAPSGLFATWDAYLENYQKANMTSQTDWDFSHLMIAYYDSYSNAKYRVDLIGTTLDGKEVILDTLQVDSPTDVEEISSITDAQGNEKPLTTLDGKTATTYKIRDYECTFTDSNNVWDTYPLLTARITRLGSLTSVKYDNNAAKKDSNDATYLLPRYTEQSVQVKLKLGTISKPVVSLLKEDGKFITNDLVYEVGWGAITDENQKQDLGGYLITVSVLESADEDQVTKTHYYYVTDTYNHADTIGLDTGELEKNGIVEDVTRQYERSDDECRTRINLSDFNSDDIVEISVKAIARTRAEYYTDGADGVPTELMIPKRLKTPDVEKLGCTVSDNSIPEETMTVDVETYRKGVSFRYEAGNYSETATAEISMAAAVYDERPEDEEDTSLVTGEWNENAQKTLFDKEDAFSLGYASDGSACVLDITAFERYPGEYAGKWLKNVLQATCPTEIDSQWTDQDAADLTKNYAWIPIPHLQLADVDLEEAGAADEGGGQTTGDVIRYYYEGGIYNDSQNDSREIQIACKTLVLGEDKNVDGYHICITGVKPDEETDAPVYDLYLQRHMTQIEDVQMFDGTWDLYMAGGTEGGGQPEESAVCEQNEEAVLIGNIGVPFTAQETGESGTVQCMDLPDIEKEYSVMSALFSMTAQLRYAWDKQTNAGSFMIVLPDVTTFGESSYADDFFTQQVEVSQYVRENTAYQAGGKADYVRTSAE